MADEQGDSTPIVRPRRIGKSPRGTRYDDATPPPGLLPPADELRELEEIHPGITKALLAQWGKTLEHQRAMDMRARDDARLVAVLGLVLSFAGIAIGSITHEPIGQAGGAFIGLADLVALVTVFLRGAP